MVDFQLQNQLQQTIAIALSTSVNNYGERSYSTSTNHKGRIIGKNELVRMADGQEVVSQKQVVFPSSVSVTLTAKLYLPGESSGTDSGWIPVAIAERVDEVGSSHHTKVWLGTVGGRL